VDTPQVAPSEVPLQRPTRHVSLSIDPPLLSRFLPPAVKASTISLLDFDADSVSDDTLRLDVNVTFKSITIRRRSRIPYADAYIGTRGAEITVTFEQNPTINEHTPGRVFEVNHEHTTTVKRASSFSFKPKVSVKKPNAFEFDIEPGGHSQDTGRETAYKTSFKCGERSLDVVNDGDLITWRLDLPNHNVIRDFAYGNLHLYLECSWKYLANGALPPKQGAITLHPTDVTFFDKDRKPAVGLNLLFLKYFYWVSDRKISHPDGISVRFEAEIETINTSAE